MSEKTSIYSPLDFIPAEIACARDYEALAAQFISAERLAYISGGSGEDKTLTKNSQIFDDYALNSRVMAFHKTVGGNTEVSLFDQSFRTPLFLAPVAYQTLVHPEGEVASAYAAASTDTGIIASTLSSFSLEQIADKAGPERWFQLYFQPSWQETKELVVRAQQAGYRAIVVTVDAAVQVPSLRAVRAGFVMPEMIKAANLQNYRGKQFTEKQTSNRVFDIYQKNTVTPEQLQKLLDIAEVPVIVKGVLNPEDAQFLKDLGVDGLVVSNHGGRTIDGVPASLAVLESIRKQVGPEYPLLFDSGIRSGRDIFKALALGADAILIGRLQVYALAVAGALGVAHMLKLLREELELAMAVSACSNISAVKASRLFRY